MQRTIRVNTQCEAGKQRVGGLTDRPTDRVFAVEEGDYILTVAVRDRRITAQEALRHPAHPIRMQDHISFTHALRRIWRRIEVSHCA